MISIVAVEVSAAKRCPAGADLAAARSSSPDGARSTRRGPGGSAGEPVSAARTNAEVIGIAGAGAPAKAQKVRAIPATASLTSILALAAGAWACPTSRTSTPSRRATKSLA